MLVKLHPRYNECWKSHEIHRNVEFVSPKKTEFKIRTRKMSP